MEQCGDISRTTDCNASTDREGQQHTLKIWSAILEQILELPLELILELILKNVLKCFPVSDLG